MKQWLKRILMLLLLVIFLYSGWKIVTIRRQYAEEERTYEAAVEQFVRPAAAASTAAGGSAAAPFKANGKTEQGRTTGASSSDPQDPSAGAPSEAEREPELAPIQVDFDSLLALNGDVFGWIYCEDTVINYPVAWGRDNDYYLRRDYLGNYGTGGTIFSDAGNIKGVVDSNIILYGHNMRNHTMFASLGEWKEQEFYEEHPVMWLLTPEQDYRIDLFSCYVTDAESETYTIYRGADEEFIEYLQSAQDQSVIITPVELDPQDHYVVLSTCEYSFHNARTVIHGRLVPVDSAGGVPLSSMKGE